LVNIFLPNKILLIIFRSEPIYIDPDNKLNKQKRFEEAIWSKDFKLSVLLLRNKSILFYRIYGKNETQKYYDYNRKEGQVFCVISDLYQRKYKAILKEILKDERSSYFFSNPSFINSLDDKSELFDLIIEDKRVVFEKIENTVFIINAYKNKQCSLVNKLWKSKYIRNNLMEYDLLKNHNYSSKILKFILENKLDEF
jgi:hypothetical protein